MTDSEYTTTIKLAETMGILSHIPDYTIVGASREKELIGTGDNSSDIFWTDYAYILNNSYHLYYGSDATSSVELTETTHYSININTGQITLTTAGVTLIGTDNIYGRSEEHTSELQSH